jgi:hypothetical protein
MGEGWEGIAARSGNGENDWLDGCEANHVTIRPKKDRRRAKSALGEG